MFPRRIETLHLHGITTITAAQRRNAREFTRPLRFLGLQPIMIKRLCNWPCQDPGGSSLPGLAKITPLERENVSGP